MEFTTSETPGARIVKVHDARIDAAVAIRFKDEMRAVSVGAPGRVVLDLGEVAFIDSSGLGAVVAAKKVLAPDNELELASLTPLVDKVFRLTRMDRVFTIHPDPSTAVAIAS
ncbi:MAG: STAS domain-containing protein [Shimia sp.]